MTLTGPHVLVASRNCPLHQTIESRGLINQSLDALAESEIASTVAVTLTSDHAGGPNVQTNSNH